MTTQDITTKLAKLETNMYGEPMIDGLHFTFNGELIDASGTVYAREDWQHIFKVPVIRADPKKGIKEASLAYSVFYGMNNVRLSYGRSETEQGSLERMHNTVQAIAELAQKGAKVTIEVEVEGKVKKITREGIFDALLAAISQDLSPIGGKDSAIGQSLKAFTDELPMPESAKVDKKAKATKTTTSLIDLFK